MRLPTRRLARTLTQIERQSDAAAYAAGWIRRHADEIIARVASDSDDAIHGISYEPRGRSGGPARPVEHHALASRRDLVTDAATRMLGALRDAQTATQTAAARMLAAERAARSLCAMDPAEAAKLATSDELKHDPDDPTRSAVCANPHCQRIVARTRADRLRGGRCDACRRYLDRHGIERPRHLCAIDTDVLGTAGLGLDTTRLITDHASPQDPMGDSTQPRNGRSDATSTP